MTGVDGRARATAYAEVLGLAEWSGWTPWLDAAAWAPREPGVYLLREPDSGSVRHVGLAGERAASGRAQGLHGRLAAYRTGAGALGGFGEAALDRALADETWVEAQLHALRERGPQRSRAWVRDAVDRIDPEVSWSVCADREDARHLLTRVELLLRPHGLWTR